MAATALILFAHGARFPGMGDDLESSLRGGEGAHAGSAGRARFSRVHGTDAARLCQIPDCRWF